MLAYSPKTSGRNEKEIAISYKSVMLVLQMNSKLFLWQKKKLLILFLLKWFCDKNHIY